MTRMSAPKMDVIRFNESDVIVASNGSRKTLTISGMGTGTAGDGLFVFGGNGGSWSSLQVASRDSLFVSSIESYLGIENYNRINLNVPLEGGGYASQGLANLASDEYSNNATNYNANFNGNYTWNGSVFKHQ